MVFSLHFFMMLRIAAMGAVLKAVLKLVLP
jgi:hypothetical protein